jgi:lipopolysaccharide transport system ATP-binding protein
VQLCSRAILLHQGRILAHGSSKPVTDAYQKMNFGSPEQVRKLTALLAEVGGLADALPTDTELEESIADASIVDGDEQQPPAGEPQACFDAELIRPPEKSYGNGDVEITDVAMYDEWDRPANVLPAGRPCKLRYTARFNVAAEGARLGMMIKTVEGIDVVGVSTVHLGWRLPRIEAKQQVAALFRLVLNLTPGVYFLNCGVSAMVEGQEIYLHRRVDVLAFRVIADDSRDLYGVAFTDPQIEYAISGGRVLSHG